MEKTFLVFAMLATWVVAGLRLEGSVSDSLFISQDSIEIILLENGSFEKVAGPNFNFSLAAPNDSTWNVCVLSSTSEKCYLHRAPNWQDTSGIARVVLSEENRFEIYSESFLDSLEGVAVARNGLLDSLEAKPEVLEDEDDVKELVLSKRRLRKVVISLKKRPKRSLGQTTVSAKSIKRMPSLAEADVVKALQALPGVVASSDFSSKIYVRGGGADQNLFLFDNAPVYSPVHFFGLFSTFLVEGVDEVNFYKGGFPPRFGNRLSSVVDITTRDGGPKERIKAWKWNTGEIVQETAQTATAILRPVVAPLTSLAQLSLKPIKWIGLIDSTLEESLDWNDLCDPLGCMDSTKDQFAGTYIVSTFASSLLLEGSSERFKFQFAGRATYLKEMLGVLRDAGLTDIELDYGFYDFQGRVSWETESGDDEFALSWYQGKDELIFTPLFASWGNTAIPFNYKHRINNNLNFKSTTSFSKFEQRFELENIFAFLNNIYTTGTVNKVVWNADKENQFEFGLQADYFDVDFTNEPLLLNASADEGDEIVLVDRDDYFQYSPFIQWDWETINWKFVSGLRADYHSLWKSPTLDPRFSLTKKMDDNLKWDFHIGYYHQYINSILFGDFETINEFYYPAKTLKYNEIGPSSSLLLSTGLSQTQLWENLEWNVEGYFKTLNNLISFQESQAPDSVRQDPESKLGEYLFSTEGYAYGLELSSRYSATPVGAGASYSYGRAILKENNQVFPANWDKSHSVKMDMSIDWKGKEGIWKYKAGKENKNRYWRSSIMLTWTSGLPYTAPRGYHTAHQLDGGSGQRPGGPNPVLESGLSIPTSTRNGQRYPDYLRLDIKIFDYGVEGKWNFSWTAINLTDNENVFTYAYDTQKTPPERTTVGQFPFFPLLLSFQGYF